MKKLLSTLRFQMVAFSAGAVITCVAVVLAITGTSLQEIAVAKARNGAVDRLGGVSGRINSRVSESAAKAATLGRVLAGIKDPDIALDLGREPIIAIMKKSLTEAPNLLGVFTAWEPDALDGMDMGYGDTEGHDSTGRFIPMVRRNAEGEAELTFMPDMSEAIKAEQSGTEAYLRALENSNGLVADRPNPNDPRFGGRGSMDVLYAIPSKETETVAGVMGVSIDLDDLEQLIEDKGLLNEGASIALLDSFGSALHSCGEHKDQMTDLPNDAMVAVASGETWVREIDGSLVCATPVPLDGVDGSLILQARIPMELITAEADASTNSALTLGFLAMVACVIGLVFIVRYKLRPLGTLAERLRNIREGDGDLTQRLPEVGSRELKSVAESFNQFVEKLTGILQRVAEQSHALTEGSESVARITEKVASQTDQASAQTGDAATGAARIATDIQGVSGNLDEMAQAISEIASQASQATMVTSTTSSKLEENDQSIARLGERSQEIAQFVNVINGISEQTNLLALNATIEAARAGESGKGFAVVATEVKELANQAAKATDDIRSLIEVIQKEVAEAMRVGHEVDEAFQGIAEISSAIAAAVEEQTAVTSEVRTALERVAGEVDSVAKSVANAANNAEQAKSEASECSSSIQEANTQAKDLESVVSTFRF